MTRAVVEDPQHGSTSGGRRAGGEDTGSEPSSGWVLAVSARHTPEPGQQLWVTSRPGRTPTRTPKGWKGGERGAGRGIEARSSSRAGAVPCPAIGPSREANGYAARGDTARRVSDRCRSEEFRRGRSSRPGLLMGRPTARCYQQCRGTLYLAKSGNGEGCTAS